MWDLWQQNPIFAAAGEAACRELCQRYPARRHAAGQVLVQLGQAADRVFVVLEGTVRIYQQAGLLVSSRFFFEGLPLDRPDPCFPIKRSV